MSTCTGERLLDGGKFRGIPSDETMVPTSAHASGGTYNVVWFPAKVWTHGWTSSVKVGVKIPYPNSWIISSDSDGFLAIQAP